MRSELTFSAGATSLACGLALISVAACSSSSSGSPDAAAKDGSSPEGAADGGSPRRDAGPQREAGPEATVTGIEVVSARGEALQAAPGDALPLEVLYTMSDGTTLPVPASSVTWTAPNTITAQSPEDAGPTGILPEAGAAPTAFFLANPYRISPVGVLFVIDPGTSTPASVTVGATVKGAGSATASVSILPTPVGDAAHGQMLFQTVIMPACAGCHGMTGAGSPPSTRAPTPATPGCATSCRTAPGASSTRSLRPG